MSYNGVGLLTARGSGTNGYVQRNLGYVKASWRGSAPQQSTGIASLIGERKANKDILLHEAKRKVEVQLLLFREKLEEKGYGEEEIEQRVNEARSKLLAELEQGKLDTSGKRDTHSLNAAKSEENSRLAQAFGIRSDFTPGTSFAVLNKEKNEDKQQQNSDEPPRAPRRWLDHVVERKGPVREYNRERERERRDSGRRYDERRYNRSRSRSPRRDERRERSRSAERSRDGRDKESSRRSRSPDRSTRERSDRDRPTTDRSSRRSTSRSRSPDTRRKRPRHDSPSRSRSASPSSRSKSRSTRKVIPSPAPLIIPSPAPLTGQPRGQPNRWSHSYNYSKGSDGKFQCGHAGCDRAFATTQSVVLKTVLAAVMHRQAIDDYIDALIAQFPLDA